MAARTEQMWRWTVLGLVLVTCAGLAVDVWVHLDVAGSYALVKTSVVSQADLFRVEAGAAGVSAVALLLRRNRLTALIAAVVAGGGAAAVLLYTYVDPGQLGPLPDMYEPVWYAEKTASFIGEAVAAVTAVGLLVVLHPRSRSLRAPATTSVSRPSPPDPSWRAG